MRLSVMDSRFVDLDILGFRSVGVEASLGFADFEFVNCDLAPLRC